MGPLLRLVGKEKKAIRALFDGLSLAWLFASCLALTLYAAGTLGFSGVLLAIIGFGLARLGSHFFPVRSNWPMTAALALLGAALLEPPRSGPILLEALAAGVLAHFALSPSEDGENHCSHHHEHGEHHAPDSAHHSCHHHHHGHEPTNCDHHHHHGACDHGQANSDGGNTLAALGALSGLSIFIAMAHLVEPNLLAGQVGIFLRSLMALALESSPALLLGYLLAGLIPLFLNPTRMSFLSQGGPGKQALRGVAFGLPLPICSCGVLPIYESLIRKGVPTTAALAFLVATPELGLDAVLLSLPLLGSSLTWARVIWAFVVALLVAWIVGRAGEKAKEAPEEEEADSPTRSWGARARDGLRFGLVDIFDHTMPWIALGLIAAALAEPLLSHGALATIPALLQSPLAALVGIPIYVCASGATPVVALALHKGLTAGAAISFLIAGPATNLTTFGVLARLHGRFKAILFGVSVVGFAVLAGWAVDLMGIAAKPILQAHGHSFHGPWLAWFCLICLMTLGLSSLFRQGPRGIVGQILEPIHTH